MSFDKKMEMLYDSKLVISQFTIADTVPSATRKELHALAAPWLGEGFKNTKRRLSISESTDSFTFQPAPSPFVGTLSQINTDDERRGVEKLKVKKDKKNKKKLDQVTRSGSAPLVGHESPAIVKKETKFILPADSQPSSSHSSGATGEISPRSAREQLKKSPPAVVSSSSGGNLAGATAPHSSPSVGGRKRRMSESATSIKKPLSSSQPNLGKKSEVRHNDDSDVRLSHLTQLDMVLFLPCFSLTLTEVIKGLTRATAKTSWAWPPKSTDDYRATSRKTNSNLHPRTTYLLETVALVSLMTWCWPPAKNLVFQEWNRCVIVIFSFELR